ncbi:hypothetical protein BD779DRAFT_1468710 [Infundibulicybe gibba]|nr:hypothetical protein BD779DRAFT_1468710 [Infundibulicybe gibba]
MLRAFSSAALAVRNPVNRSAYVRTWTFVESPADAFALIRGIEKKYGPIAEYRFYRDCEVNTAYQLVMHLTFVNESSYYKIPADADVLHIPAPPTHSKPGGIGLADIVDLLPRRSAPSTSLDAPIPKFGSVMQNVLSDPAPGAPRTIDCRIQRYESGFYTPPALPPSGPPRRIRDDTARQLVNWGGFHSFPPIPRDTPLPSDILFPSSASSPAAEEKGGEGALEHVRMRRALRRASEFLGMPNPYELAPATTSSATPSTTSTTAAVVEETKGQSVVPPLPEAVWDPLPGVVDAETEAQVDLCASVPQQPPNAVSVEEEEASASLEVPVVEEVASEPLSIPIPAQTRTQPNSGPGLHSSPKPSSQAKQNAQSTRKQKQNNKQKHKQPKPAQTRIAQHTNPIPTNANTGTTTSTPTPTPAADAAPTPDPALAVRNRLKNFVGGWF